MRNNNSEHFIVNFYFHSNIRLLLISKLLFCITVLRTRKNIETFTWPIDISIIKPSHSPLRYVKADILNIGINGVQFQMGKQREGLKNVKVWTSLNVTIPNIYGAWQRLVDGLSTLVLSISIMKLI